MSAPMSPDISKFSDTQRALWEKLQDREWRMDNLYHVKDKWGQIVQFVRNESQMRFWRAMWFLNIILKDRQRGFSTLIAIFMLDYCLFNPNTNAGIIDIKLDEGKKKLNKIKLAYDHLPPWLREIYPMTVRAAESVAFANGSEIYVGTSHRGGTLEILHVSEIGAIAARNPDRAREIRTGALNTLAKGNIVIYESTAEGTGGEFYELCKAAEEKILAEIKLTWLDFKFHFFGWWMGHENEMDPQGIEIDAEHQEYFNQLEKELKIKIGPRKRAWYVKKEEQQGDDMQREFPSTPDEAFAASVEGAYLAKQLRHLKANKQITAVPWEPGVPVNTGWDFGLRDYMIIWMHQRVGLQDRIFNFMFGEDDDVLYYWRELERLPYTWGRHFVPHDAGHRRIGTAKTADTPPQTLKQIMERAGMKNVVPVPRIDNKATAIQEVKVWLPKAFIDKDRCKKGTEFLTNFRREWDDALGVWKNRPRHDINMHGYDGLETLVRGLNMAGDIVRPKGNSAPRPARNWRAA